ncbi:MAG: hypothetical protein DMG69_18735 [Acidobacteria bacterium]|nr:MAG: hypothetical protein DMG69_18735 [Acidobacteriota bacterium]
MATPDLSRDCQSAYDSIRSIGLSHSLTEKVARLLLRWGGDGKAVEGMIRIKPAYLFVPGDCDASLGRIQEAACGGTEWLYAAGSQQSGARGSGYLLVAAGTGFGLFLIGVDETGFQGKTLTGCAART